MEARQFAEGGICKCRNHGGEKGRIGLLVRITAERIRSKREVWTEAQTLQVSSYNQEVQEYGVKGQDQRRSQSGKIGIEGQATTGVVFLLELSQKRAESS